MQVAAPHRCVPRAMQELGSLDKTRQLRAQHRPAGSGSVNSPYLLPHLLIQADTNFENKIPSGLGRHNFSGNSGEHSNGCLPLST